jgi:CheY-like chemotaxis protein
MKKIMVVENSTTIISVADSLLRQRGYDVTCLSDGNKALEFARSERPDLILTAIGVTGIDGLQLCKKISSDPLTGGIPVILLMGEKDAIYEDKIDVSGARGRINKPFSPKELITVVDKFTGGAKPAVARVIDQKTADGPKLKPKVQPQEIGTSTKNVLTEKESINRHETVFNLDWTDLKNDPDFEPERTAEFSGDESGLVLDEDQYGLTRLPEDDPAAAKKGGDEDYDWVVGEMKKEIEGKDDKGSESGKAAKAATKVEEKVAYKDLGPSPTSRDDAKYHQFLEQFKKDTEALSEKSGQTSGVDVNWLVDRIADKLAQKIIEKIDRDEIRQIINSVLGGPK